MPVAGLEHQLRNSFAARQLFDLDNDFSADALALCLRPRVHPLHLADAVGVPAKRAACDGAAVIARDEDGRLGIRHLLDRHVEAEFRRRQRKQSAFSSAISPRTSS